MSYISLQESEERPGGMKDGPKFNQKLVIKSKNMGRNASENGLYLQMTILMGKMIINPLDLLAIYFQTNLYDTTGVTHDDR